MSGDLRRAYILVLDRINYLRIRNCNQLQESPNKSGARIIRYVAGLY